MTSRQTWWPWIDLLYMEAQESILSTTVQRKQTPHQWGMIWKTACNFTVSQTWSTLTIYPTKSKMSFPILFRVNYLRIMLNFCWIKSLSWWIMYLRNGDGSRSWLEGDGRACLPPPVGQSCSSGQPTPTALQMHHYQRENSWGVLFFLTKKFRIKHCKTCNHSSQTVATNL